MIRILYVSEVLKISFKSAEKSARSGWVNTVSNIVLGNMLVAKQVAKYSPTPCWNPRVYYKTRRLGEPRPFGTFRNKTDSKVRWTILHLV